MDFNSLFLEFSFSLLFCIAKHQDSAEARILKPVMFGEPLNPRDYENGLKYKINKLLANDMTKDDGTYDDIIKPSKPSLLRDADFTGIAWPNAELPYLIDDAFTVDDRTKIAKAIQLIEGGSCVRIIARTTEENYVLIVKNTESRVCQSSVGMQGGKQTINLAERCIEVIGSTSHELMHTLGFHHEQSRPDRDKYIDIYSEHIKEGMEFNFKKVNPPPNYANLIAAYDTLSITHYSQFAFSKDGKHTMDPKPGYGDRLGQRENLTKLDMKKVNVFYNCSSLTMPMPTNSGANFTAANGTTGARTYGLSRNDTEDGNFRQYDGDESYINNSNNSRSAFICNDFDPESCELWGKYGYCKKSPIFMTVYCRMTCNECGNLCQDINKKCPKWAKKNYCKIFSHYMDNYCAMSCNICARFPPNLELPSDILGK